MADTWLYMVYSNAVEGGDDAFNDWYDNVHVREVVGTPGMVSAQRYRVVETEMDRLMGTQPAHRYCVAYEMNEDPDVVMTRIRAQVDAGEMHMHDSLDLSTVGMSFWTPHGPKIEK